MNIILEDTKASLAKILKLNEVSLNDFKNSKVIDIRSPLNNGDVSNFQKFMQATEYSIPLALNKIAAGFPSPAEDYIDKTIDMNELLIANKEATFIVQVESLSMKNIGIGINDYLIVDRSIRSQHQDIVVAFIDNDFTVKRLMITQFMLHDELVVIFGESFNLKEIPAVWLMPENAEYTPILPRSEQELVIWGVVSKVVKNFK